MWWASKVSRIRPGWTGAFLTCGVNHHNLALFEAPPNAEPRTKTQIGLNHFAFKVEDYESASRGSPEAD